MSDIRILFLDTNHPVMIALLREAGFTCDEDYSSTKEEVQAKLGDYHGVVIRSRFLIDRAFIEAGTSLRCISRAGAGMENIDVAYAESRGIRCLHAPEGNRDAVGEQAVGMLLALFNNLCRADRQVREGVWIREGNRGHELAGKTVGIIGFGNMGSAFAQRLRGFDVRVLAYDKYKKGFGDSFVTECDLETLQQEADVLSLHIPLTDETRFLVNDDFIVRFRKNFWLINTARGKNVDTAALVRHMKTGKVMGACLDVIEYESVSFEQLDAASLPEPFRYLLSSERTLLSPHIAGWTYESHEKIGRVLAAKTIMALREKG